LASPPPLLEVLLEVPPLELLLVLTTPLLLPVPESRVVIGELPLLLLPQATAASEPATATSAMPVTLRRLLLAFISVPRRSQSGMLGLILCKPWPRWPPCRQCRHGL
jgi:hypothetical protein